MEPGPCWTPGRDGSVEGRGQMPEGKQAIKSRMEIDKRKPSAFSLDSYQTMLRCRLWAWVWPEIKGALMCGDISEHRAEL